MWRGEPRLGGEGRGRGGCIAGEPFVGMEVTQAGP